MQNKKILEEKFATAQKNYHTIKQDTELKVVQWFWATDTIFSLEPFYFEENRFSKGRIHKIEPAKKENQYQYGVDENHEIIVERQFTELKGLFYETFYIRDEHRIESYRYNYSPEKKIDSVRLFIYSDLVLTTSYGIFKSGWVKYTYNYQNSHLVSKGIERVYKNEKVPDRVFEYAYDNIGLLQSIKEKEHFWYKKPDKKITYKKLTELVSDKLLALLKQNILNYNIKEKLYCIYIYYYHEHILPPSIGFGTQNERENWLNNEGKEAKWLIWNPIDYSHSCEIELDEETQNLFDLYNQETALKNKENSTVKMIVECCKKLKADISEFELNTTNDFVFVAADYEQCDLKKNFKKINPEKFQDFKKTY